MQSGKVDRNKVSLSTEVEALYWTARLGATRAAVEQAVQSVGTSPDAAAEWLRNVSIPPVREATSHPPAACGPGFRGKPDRSS